MMYKLYNIACGNSRTKLKSSLKQISFRWSIKKKYLRGLIKTGSRRYYKCTK